jgi:hypothetical protein
MQQDEDNLHEEDRKLLCLFCLPQHIFTLQQRHNAQGVRRDARIKWFFVRVQITDRYRAYSMPSPPANEPAAKRCRGEGGSARGEGGSARGEGGSARGEDGSARSESGSARSESGSDCGESGSDSDEGGSA